MATNFDKASYQAPKGLEQEGGEPIEIEVIDPKARPIRQRERDLNAAGEARRQRTLALRAEVCRRAAAGETQAYIAAVLKIGRTTVQRYVKALQPPRRGRPPLKGNQHADA